MESTSTTYRVRVYKNGDWPANYGWEWTAALEEWYVNEAGVDDFDTLGHGDGDTPGDAVQALRDDYPQARRAEVEVV